MSTRLLLIASALALLPAAHAQDVLPLVSPTPRAPGHFGGAVAGVPDLDGDGHGDLVVGADWEANLAGRVHVFSGATGALLRTLVSPTPSTSPSGTFGLAVAGVPDLDADGTWDIVVGTSSEGSSATGYGRAHVFSGATGALVRTLLSPNPEGGGQAFPSFGCSVAGLPDLDGDGRGDLLVGACREDTNDAGRAYLFSGATGALLRTLTSPNPEANGSFGFRVDGVPDADGDGATDLLVAAHTEDAGASNSGRAYLFSGATGALLRTFVSPNPIANGIFGRDTEGVPDLDGDGRGEVLVGAGGDLGTGRAYLFSGATGALLRTFASPNPRVGGRFGDALGAVPDVDGDGTADLLVGAYVELEGTIAAGRAHLFSGATGALLRSLGSLNPKPSGFFGYSVAGVPDADGDGRGDLLVGGVQEDGPGTSTGRAYLFAGAAGVDAEPGPDGLLGFDVVPNPARAGASLTLTLDRPEAVTAALYDALGRRVAVLHDGPLGAGPHAFPLDAARLPAGVYVVRVETPAAALTHRLTLVR
jgi:hypothetical protein